MNELQTIREALEYCRSELNAHVAGPALDAIDMLEAREASFATAGEIANSIIDNRAPDRTVCASLIGQYAYRYSEDIRKDRDYWKKTAESLHDAILQHIENHKGERLPVYAPNKDISCPNCGASPLRIMARRRDGSGAISADGQDYMAVCASCNQPMPEGWSQA
jgi:hypothetical protein